MASGSTQREAASRRADHNAAVFPLKATIFNKTKLPNGPSVWPALSKTEYCSIDHAYMNGLRAAVERPNKSVGNVSNHQVLIEADRMPADVHV
eukprot:4401305-Karenia_brevis.AAC.1